MRPQSKAALGCFVLAFLLLVVQVVRADVPHSTSEYKHFATLHDAVMYAADRLERCSHFYECYGVIARDPLGKFVVSGVHTDYASDHVGGNHEVPTGWTFAADIHSHPCILHHATGLFSPQDMMGSVLTRAPHSYMVDMCTGDVHEFTPGETKMDEVAVDNIWLSPGKIVGHVAAFKNEPLAHEGI